VIQILTRATGEQGGSPKVKEGAVVKEQQMAAGWAENTQGHCDDVCVTGTVGQVTAGNTPNVPVLMVLTLHSSTEALWGTRAWIQGREPHHGGRTACSRSWPHAVTHDFNFNPHTSTDATTLELVSWRCVHIGHLHFQ
jgi:hypothetical protein